MALKHVHYYHIIHRDLKPANLFWDHNMNLKLADFGIARVLSSSKSKADSQVGSPAYMAPEIITNDKYSIEVDIWSLGVILYYMHTLYLPFEAKNLKSLFKQVLAVSYDTERITNKSFKSIIKACLKKKVEHRCTID